MGGGDLEVLVPEGVLGVGDDGGADEGGAGEDDGNVGVAGDDFFVGAVGVVGGDAGGAGGAGGETDAEALGEDVHVGEAAGLDDAEVEVAVEELGTGVASGCGGGGSSGAGRVQGVHGDWI